MHVDIAGAAEQAVFEMMRLEIGDRMRHVLLARDERLLPQDVLAAADARDALDVGGPIADEQRRPEARGPELGMGGGEIILPPRDTVGKFGAGREAPPEPPPRR